jgi:hypothetical protein
MGSKNGSFDVSFTSTTVKTLQQLALVVVPRGTLVLFYPPTVRPQDAGTVPCAHIPFPNDEYVPVIIAMRVSNEFVSRS